MLKIIFKNLWPPGRFTNKLSKRSIITRALVVIFLIFLLVVCQDQIDKPALITGVLSTFFGELLCKFFL